MNIRLTFVPLFVDGRVLNKGVYFRFSADVHCLKNKATTDETNFHVPIYPGLPYILPLGA